jgi:hypothetical protein
MVSSKTATPQHGTLPALISLMALSMTVLSVP